MNTMTALAPADSLSTTLLDDTQQEGWPAAFAALESRVAATNSAADQWLLGRCLHLGRGTTKDLLAAGRCYRLAADQGLADAQCDLAILLGKAGAVREATDYYRLAADQGHTIAQFNLATLLADRWGAAREEEAIRYYRLAADKGYAKAQCNLALSLTSGKGVAKNEAEAARYYRLAADQGDSTAQFYLAVSLENGNGLPKDLPEAVRYYRLAADQGSEVAQVLLDRLLANEGKDLKVFAVLGRLCSPSGAPVVDVTLRIIDIDPLVDDLLGLVSPQPDGSFLLAFSHQDFNQGFLEMENVPDQLLVQVARRGPGDALFLVYEQKFPSPGFAGGITDLGSLTIPEGPPAADARRLPE